MQTGVASEDAMVAVGIDLHVELFAKLYEVFGIFRAILEMNVIIRHAMYQQQIAMQVVGTSKGGRGFVTFGIFFRGTHETFAVYGIVIVPVGNRSNGCSGFEYGSSFAHAHNGHVAAITPAPDPDTIFVYVRLAS